MTLQDLIERLQSHPAYQAGHASDTQVYIEAIWPLAARDVIGLVTGHYDGETAILLRQGPLENKLHAGDTHDQFFDRKPD